jgi:hypothetical protein
MKITLLISTIIFSIMSYAKPLTQADRAERASLSIRLANYKNQTTTNEKVTVLDDLQKLASLELSEENDLELVKNAFVTLLNLEDADPSRTGVFMLSDSYRKNTALFQKAAGLIRKHKNKNSLPEILQIMKSFSTEGNG